MQPVYQALQGAIGNLLGQAQQTPQQGYNTTLLYGTQPNPMAGGVPSSTPVGNWAQPQQLPTNPVAGGVGNWMGANYGPQASVPGWSGPPPGYGDTYTGNAPGVPMPQGYLLLSIMPKYLNVALAFSP